MDINIARIRLKNDQKKILLRKLLTFYLNSTKKEKERINILTCSFNSKNNGNIEYFDTSTREQISDKEYERRYYKFVLLRDI